MKRHFRTHTGEKPFECQECHKHFGDSTGLKYHLITHSRIRVKELKCGICNKKFVYSGSLNRHYLYKHKKVKKNSCNFCGKSFSGLTKLTTHMITHTKVKAYKCQFCSNDFQSSGSLKIHIRVHAHEKLFQCQYCAQKFNCRSELTKHAKVRYQKRELQNSYLCYTSSKVHNCLRPCYVRLMRLTP